MTTRKQQKLDRIERRIKYATGKDVDVAAAATVKDELNEPAKVKVAAKPLPHEEVYVGEDALYTYWEKDGSQYGKAKGNLYNW